MATTVRKHSHIFLTYNTQPDYYYDWPQKRKIRVFYEYFYFFR